MKKILAVFAVVAIAAVTAKADYLYWQVPAEHQDDSWNVSSLWGFDSTNTEKVYLGWANKGETGEGNVSLTNFDYANATYYIELGTYNSSTEPNYIAKEYYGGFSYSDLHVTLTALESATMKMSAWTGKSAVSGAVPEPTSGLMMLVGMALLGLKRRRA